MYALSTLTFTEEVIRQLQGFHGPEIRYFSDFSGGEILTKKFAIFTR